jgi:type I restriction enzyme, S subunit
VSDDLIRDHYPFKNAAPAGWSVTAIEQVASEVTSGFPSGAHNSEGRGVPHLRPMNIDREGRFDLSEVKYVDGEVPRMLRNGDVLFNNTNSPELIGKTTDIAVDIPLAYSNHMTRISLERGMNPRFVARQLHYLWMSGYFRHRCKNHVNQASFASDPLSKTVPLLVAPECEQSRIVDAIDELLSDLDAGVKALEGIRAKLTQYRAAVLKAAVGGKLSAEWRKAHPHVEPASKLLKRILAERRRRWEKAQLKKYKDAGKEPPRNWRAKYEEPIGPDTTTNQPLPEHWSWTCLGECFEVHVGATPSRANTSYWRGDIPWIASGEVQFCQILESRERITLQGLENSSTRLNPIGSVILNMIGEGKTRGKAGILQISACNNQNCAAIWVSQTEVLPEFVYYWLMFRYEQTRELGSGNNQPAMNKSIVELIPLPLPPLAEQAAIVDLVEDQLSVIDHLESDLEAKLESAAALRQSILKAAFEGKLVPQDPNDERASELLKRIAAERAERERLAKQAKEPAKQAKVRVPKQNMNVVSAG